MAVTSGTVNRVVFDVQSVMDTAWRRCKLPTSTMTSEWVQIGRNALLLLLSNLSNQGIPLWRIDNVLLPLTVGQTRLPCPIGTIDALNILYRTMNEYQGTLVSSDAQDAAAADDHNTQTFFVQNAPDGSLAANMGSGVIVSTFGLMSYTDQYYQLVVEYSLNNGSTWVAALAPAQQLYVDGLFSWFNIDAVPPAAIWRVRETGGNTLSVREVVFASNPQDVPLGVLNLDDYSAYPNKAFPGPRPVEFWFDKQRDPPDLVIWPAPQDPFVLLSTWLHLEVEDITSQTQLLDVPKRWLNAITQELAAYWAQENPDVPDDREQRIVARAQSLTMQAWSHESDRGPVRIQADITAYTR